MITKTILRNWRSHEDTELTFSQGTNGLVGILGSGKSSVLDGICFALFGTFPNLQSKKLKLDDLIMKKPIEKNRAEIEVTFDEDGKSYVVKRIIEKGKGTTHSELQENGKIIESPSAARVTEVVEKILKVNYDLFSKAIYSEQNALDYFLTIARGQRMKRIDELLMIDKFEKARTSTISLLNKIVERKESRQVATENTDLNEVKNTIAQLNNSLENLEKDKTNFEKEKSSTSVQRQQLETEYTKLSRMKEEIENLTREEKSITGAIEEIIIELNRLEKSMKNLDKEEIEKSLREISKLSRNFESDLNQKRLEYERIYEQATKSKAEAEFTRKQKLETLEKELELRLAMQKEIDRNKRLLSKDLDKEMDEKKLQIEKFVGEIEALKIKIQDLQEIIEQLSSVEGKCPLCNAKLTDEKKIILIKQKAFQIESLKEKIVKDIKKKAETEEEMKNLEAAIEKLKEMLELVKNTDKIKTELENTKNIYTVLSESAVKLESELKQLRKEVSNTEENFKNISTRKIQLEQAFLQISNYEDKKNRLTSFLRKREELFAHLKEKENLFSGKELGTIELELRRLLAKEKELETKLVATDQLILERKSRLNDYENILQSAEKSKSEIERLEKILQELKKFEKALEETQSQLRKEFVVSVNYAMNDLWTNLYPYQDFVGVKLAIDEGDYVLQLQERSGRWVNVEGFASGGERSIAALTLRIAFALVLAPQLRWLVLDEPTANLDAKAVEDLATTLSERIGSFIDQVFLITHDERLENAITGVAYRFYRDKSNDSITQVNMIA